MADVEKSAAIAQNETLYIQNLDEKLPKQELRELLYVLCSQYGRIVDVVCVKNTKMRGQAHVAFQDVSSASAALRALQGFLFNHRPIRVSYAKTKSRKVLELDDIFTSDEKLIESLLQKRKRMDEEEQEQIAKVHRTLLQAKVESENDIEEVEMELASDEEKEPTTSAPVYSNGTSSKVLFIQNIPSTLTKEELLKQLKTQKGFKDLRFVPGQTHLAFAEFKGVSEAINAFEALQDEEVQGQQLKLSFAKE